MTLKKFMHFSNSYTMGLLNSAIYCFRFFFSRNEYVGVIANATQCKFIHFKRFSMQRFTFICDRKTIFWFFKKFYFSNFNPRGTTFYSSKIVKLLHFKLSFFAKGSRFTSVITKTIISPSEERTRNRSIFRKMYQIFHLYHSFSCLLYRKIHLKLDLFFFIFHVETT